MADESKKTPGITVDAYGHPAIDPTTKVLSLVDAATRRLDDLRIETNRRIDSDVIHVGAISLLRTEYTDKVATLRSEQAEKISELRASHQKEMDHAESQRLDSIRTVDVQAAAVAASQILTAVQTLAGGTGTMAENLRASTAAPSARSTNVCRS